MWIFGWVVFNFFQSITGQTGQTGCREIHSISGYSLTRHTHRTLAGIRLFTCVVTCQDDPQCHSINFKLTQKLCELNTSTRESAGFGYFVPSVDTVYLNRLYPPSKQCDNSPCKHGGTCYNTNHSPGFVCNCKTGYKGPTCQECSQYASQKLGMETGQILDSQVTASSEQTFFEASHARAEGNTCWRSKQNVIGEFLEVNFLSQKYIQGMKVQGDPNANNWVEKFYLSYYLGSVWKNVTGIGSQDESVKIFDGVTYRGSTTMHVFPGNMSFYATAIRVYPVQWHGTMALRLEFYGC